MKYVHAASGLVVNIQEGKDVVKETTLKGDVVETYLETDGGQKACKSHPGSSDVMIVATDIGLVEVSRCIHE